MRRAGGRIDGGRGDSIHIEFVSGLAEGVLVMVVVPVDLINGV
jgi:hypothetical protein